MADERKPDEIDFTKGQGYLVDGVLVDAEGKEVKPPRAKAKASDDTKPPADDQNPPA